jgi:hypothetical protein
MSYICTHNFIMRRLAVPVLLFLFSNSSYAGGAPKLVIGFVKDANSNVGIMDAIVHVSLLCVGDSSSCRTDGNGSFYMNIDSKCDSITLMVSKSSVNCSPNYLTATRTIDLRTLQDTIKIYLSVIQNTLTLPSFFFRDNSMLYSFDPDSEARYSIINTNYVSLPFELISFIEVANCDRSFNIHIESYYPKNKGAQDSTFALIRAESLMAIMINMGIEPDRITISVLYSQENKLRSATGELLQNKSVIRLKTSPRRSK